MIELQALRHKILDIPALSIPEGHCMVIGPNGAGKSTLLELCAGMQVPAGGTVSVSGTDPRRCTVGWVSEFTDRTVVFDRVFDEIASPLRFAHRPCGEIDTRVRETAALIGIGHLLAASTQEISGGEKTLVALATAVIASPPLLVLDDPDTHCDARTARHVQQVLGRLPIPHILQCTQDMDTAIGADTVLYMEKGRVVHAGTPQEVFSRLASSCFYPECWRNGPCA
ncbi:MAG: ABC transporter [Methanoculleus sp. SDB]|nr:MAG: ABC transporter [Methanoculleus sp. SDB]